MKLFELFLLLEDVLKQNFPEMWEYEESIRTIQKEHGIEVQNEGGKPLFSIPSYLQE